MRLPFEGTEVDGFGFRSLPLLPLAPQMPAQIKVGLQCCRALASS